MPRNRVETTKSPPRVMIEVTEHQFNTLKKFLPYGYQKQMFRAVIEDLVQMWEAFGDDFTRAMLAKNLTYKQFMNDYIERNYGDIRESKEPPIPRNDLGGTISLHEGNPSTEASEDSTKSGV
jgi:hypothetical protein